MNTKFNGCLTRHKKHQRGYTSKAAKQAFKDIRKDEDMKVYVDYYGVEIQVNIILSEEILEEEY